jgi:hypothetical protein
MDHAATLPPALARSPEPPLVATTVHNIQLRSRIAPTVTPMDLHLPLLAEINLHLGVAEEACSEAAWQTARNQLEKAEASFQELRELWPGMDSTERGLLAAMVKPLKARYDAAEARLPRLAAVSEGTPEPDAELEAAPED